MTNVKFEKLKFDLNENIDIEVGQNCVRLTDEEIKDLAAAASREAEGPCIAIDGYNNTISIDCAKGCARRAIVFNAALTRAAESEFRITVRNHGKGALTEFWYSAYAKTEQGRYI